jgi:exopolysaccharide biosynthesis WecB/TagA/CpsF family protein
MTGYLPAMPAADVIVGPARAAVPAVPSRPQEFSPVQEPAGRAALPGPIITVGELPETLPVAHFASLLADNLERGDGGVVTWLNHHSALLALRAGIPLGEFDYLGLDGIFLCRLLESAVPRTSADLLLPVLLEQTRGLRIAFIGSTTETLRMVADKASAMYGHDVVLMCDGYAGLPEPGELRRALVAADVQVAIVGLGAPRQDAYALALRSPGMLVMTCGGWLDQFAGGTYYPAWAYPLRLNWLVRLAREPKRLWRRYTIDAVRALRAKKALVAYLTGEGRRPLAAVSAGAHPAVTGVDAA